MYVHVYIGENERGRVRRVRPRVRLGGVACVVPLCPGRDGGGGAPATTHVAGKFQCIYSCKFPFIYSQPIISHHACRRRHFSPSHPRPRPRATLRTLRGGWRLCMSMTTSVPMAGAIGSKPRWTRRWGGRSACWKRGGSPVHALGHPWSLLQGVLRAHLCRARGWARACACAHAQTRAHTQDGCLCASGRRRPRRRRGSGWRARAGTAARGCRAAAAQQRVCVHAPGGPLDVYLRRLARVLARGQ